MKHTAEKLKGRNLIGSRLRIIRQKAEPSISQEDLAGKMAAKGILLDRSAISRIENQQRYLMDYEIIALAKCLKVKISELFGE